MIDLINEIYQTMRNNKLRTFLTGIAVTWGVFMLIVLLSMARGVTNSFQDSMMSHNTAMIRVWSGTTSVPYKGNREGRRIRLKDGDMKAVPENNPKFVEDVVSRIYGGGSVSTPKAKISANYEGVFPSHMQEMGSMEISEGRFITDRDLNEKSKVIKMLWEAEWSVRDSPFLWWECMRVSGTEACIYPSRQRDCSQPTGKISAPSPYP